MVGLGLRGRQARPARAGAVGRAGARLPGRGGGGARGPRRDRPPRAAHRGARRGAVLHRRARPHRARLRALVPRHRARVARPHRPSARRGRVRAQRGGHRARAGVGGGQRRRGDPVRRRARASSAASSRVVPHDFLGTVSLDLSHLDRVLEVDPVSRAARVQAGVAGPALEAQLAEHGQTMRFFPQSFELSTLGGWIVTRAGGHFATVWTHVDDLVESIRAITPTRRLGVAAAAGQRRGAVARPAAARLARASSASSPRRGCGCSPSRRSGRRAPCASPSSCVGPRRCGRWRSRV